MRTGAPEYGTCAQVEADAEPEVAAVLVLQDGLKPASVEVISRLRSLGVTPLLLLPDDKARAPP